MTSGKVVVIATVVAAVAATLGVAIAWWQFHSTPYGALEATVTGSRFEWPPITDTLVQVSAKDAQEILWRQGIKRSTASLAKDSLVVGALASLNDDRRLSALFNSDRTYLNGFIGLTIRNTGSQTVQRVAVRVPTAQMWCMTREASARICSFKAVVFDVGDLGPLEQIGVVAWTKYPPESELREIRVTHSNGVARLKQGEVAKIPSFWEKNWDKVFLLGLIVLLALLLVPSLTKASSTSSASSAEGPKNPNSEAG